MDRRRFLELVGASAVPTAARGATINGTQAVPGGARSSKPASPRKSPAQTKSLPLDLRDLLRKRMLPLGEIRSHQSYVSLDDIAGDRYLEYAAQERNALVISSFVSDPDSGRDNDSSAVRRAALTRVREISPDNHRRVDSRLRDDKALKPGDVLPFQLTIPRGPRKSFPVDALIAVIFEAGPGEGNGFGWVPSVFEAAGQMGMTNLILPCLGRNWKDRHTIEFSTFFESVAGKVPPGKQNLAFHFALYSQWPTFELESAVAALNGLRDNGARVTS